MKNSLPFYCLLLTLLGACTPAQSPIRPSDPPVIIMQSAPPDPALKILEDFARYRELDKDALGREIGNLSALPAPDASSKIRLAMLLWLQGGIGDAERASAVIANARISAAADDAGLRALAQILAGALADQKRLSDKIADLTQQLRDSQLRGDQLASKIEALKTIERNLLSRPENGAAPQPSRDPPR